mgnify:CR=1 FL=1
MGTAPGMFFPQEIYIGFQEYSSGFGAFPGGLPDKPGRSGFVSVDAVAVLNPSRRQIPRDGGLGQELFQNERGVERSQGPGMQDPTAIGCGG